MARTKLAPKKDREERRVLWMREEWKELEGKEAPLSSAPPIPSQKALTLKGGGEDGGRG